MIKSQKKAANSAAQGTAQTETQEATTTPAPVMQILKPETEPAPVAPKPPTLIEIKAKALENFYLAEQHDNLLKQLEKLQQFAAEVGEHATLKMFSNGEKSFTSNDPQAIAQMVEICVSNIKGRIADVEAKLTA
jgi:hypothetical protein